jgi:hypothetical protein
MEKKKEPTAVEPKSATKQPSQTSRSLRCAEKHNEGNQWLLLAGCGFGRHHDRKLAGSRSPGDWSQMRRHEPMGEENWSGYETAIKKNEKPEDNQ